MHIHGTIIIILSTFSASIIFNTIHPEEAQKDIQQSVPATEQPAEQLWNQANYEAWKLEKQARWKENERKTLADQLENLVNNYELYNSNSSEDKRKRLYAYNYMRELLNQPIVISVTEIDPAWLEQPRYEIWKHDIQKELNKYGPTKFAKATRYLITEIRKYLSTKRDEKRALHLYNILRERLNKPKINSVDDISKVWLDAIEKEIKPILIIEANKGAFALPTISQESLVEEARNLTKLIDERPVLSVKSAKSSDQFIASTETADLDLMLFHIYHELGHLKNGDLEPNIYRNDYMGERFKTGSVIANFDTDYPKLSAHLKQIQAFTELAKAKLNNFSETGKTIQKKIAKTTTFWNKPEDPEKYVHTTIGRAQESRADLFAADELLKQRRANEFLNQKKIEPILLAIKDWGTSEGPVTVEGFRATYPSNVERALYLAGFLFSHGIDVNEELRCWENFGKCIDVREYTKRHPKRSKELGDFMKVYEAGKKERQAFNYALWKTETIPQIEASNLSTDALDALIDTLASFVQEYLNKLRHNPENRTYKQEALYNYNYLRELNKLPMAESVATIDRKWLKALLKH